MVAESVSTMFSWYGHWFGSGSNPGMSHSKSVGDRFSGVKATIELCSIVLTANVHVGLDYSLRLIARRESCA